MQPVTTRHASARTSEIRKAFANTRPLDVVPACQAIIDNYNSDELTLAELAWVKAVASEYRPQNRSATRMALRSLAAFCRYARKHGITLDGTTLTVLTVSRVEVAQAAFKTGDVPGINLTAGSAQTYGSRLRDIRRALLPQNFGGTTRVDVDDVSTPYDTQEEHAQAKLCSDLDAGFDFPLAQAAAALHIGAGLSGKDIDTLHSSEWTFLPGKVVIPVHRPWERTVEVEGRWADVLHSVYRHRPGMRPLDPDATGQDADAATRIIANRYGSLRDRYRAAGQPGSLPPLLSQKRARCTYLVRRLSVCPRLDNLLHEAGLRSAAALDRYLQYLPGSTAPRRRGQR